ncbi:hypothetical protein [Aliivibrio fischeri]|uniref:hypothetical protein n=2 Tax=Aliivibrio fischeri TaxID=668 RepID=UPI0007C59B55|nr:hypothetical protein [Aliivibrio fischeri]
MSDIYMTGSLFGGDSQNIGLVQYEAFFCLSQFEEQVKSMVKELVSGKANELSELIDTKTFQESFYLSCVNSTDISLGPRFSRACIVAFYDNNDLPEYALGVTGMRCDEAFFHSWVDMVRTEQHQVILDLAMSVSQDVTEVSFNNLFTYYFEKLIKKPIQASNEFQVEVFNLASSLHHILQHSPKLYSVDLLSDAPLKSGICPSTFAQARGLYEMLRQYAPSFEDFDLKDLSALIVCNSLLGVDSYQEHSLVVSEWLNRSLLMSTTHTARH